MVHHWDRERAIYVPQETETRNDDFFMRPYKESDTRSLLDIMRGNFDRTFSLLPQNVVDAYKAANREGDFKATIRTEGTQTHIAESPDGTIVGFIVLRSNTEHIPRRNPYGEMALIRAHVREDSQKKGVGKVFFQKTEDVGRDLNVEYVTAHASGHSRPYFEEQGWNGLTVLHRMSKQDVSALVYACEKRMTFEPIPMYPKTTHIAYAGASPAREKFLRDIAGDNIPLITIPSVEDLTEDPVKAARSKALSIKPRVQLTRDINPLIVANDTRTDLITVNNAGQYTQVNRGKPTTIDDIRANFEASRNYARVTGKPAPYIIRTATYLHNPKQVDDDTFSEEDVSVWLSRQGLEELASDEGLRRYREEVRDTYGVDITQMAAGFALPIFLKRGYVVGLNDHPYESLPRKDQYTEHALHIALVGMDESAIKQRLNMTQ